MSRLYYSAFLTFVSLFFIPTLVLASPNLVSQSVINKQVISLSKSDSRNFVGALKSISTQAHVAFICEGQPLHLDLSEEDAKKLELARLESPLPLDEAIKIVATAFDYDIMPAKIQKAPQYYLLTKKYSDKEELPYVTFDEVQHSLEAIASILKRYDNPYGNEYALRKLWTSLSEDQRKQIAGGMIVSQLSEEQQAFGLELIGGMSFSSRENLENVARRLAGCRKPETFFRWDKPETFFKMETETGLRYPIYEGPFGPKIGTKQIMWSVVLNRWFNTQSGGGTTFDPMPEIKFRVTSGRLRLADIANWNEEPTTPRPANRIPARTPLQTQSLASTIAAVNERLLNSEGEITRAEVVPEIAEKPILLIGSAYVSPIDIVKSVADIYGFPVRISTERKTIRIILPTAHFTTDITEIPHEVERLLPAPFIRAMDSAMQRTVREGKSSLTASDALYIASIRRLRELIEPKLNQQMDKKLPMNKVGVEEHNLVALSSLVTCMLQLEPLRKPVSTLLTHFSEAQISIATVPQVPDQLKLSIRYAVSKRAVKFFSTVMSLPPTDLPASAQ